jgi:release factor glutamine methyltransferase
MRPLICDLGCGSGCIITSLLHERPNARGVAVDISPATVQVALRNAARHEVHDRVSFVVADGFTSLANDRVAFDLIVSNPPYVTETDYPGLQREVREHEPRVALTSGADGLNMIRRLLTEAPALVSAGGYLLFEIGYDQRIAVEQLIDARVWTLVEIRNDLQGIPRTVVLQRRSL